MVDGRHDACEQAPIRQAVRIYHRQSFGFEPPNRPMKRRTAGKSESRQSKNLCPTLHQSGTHGLRRAEASVHRRPSRRYLTRSPGWRSARRSSSPGPAVKRCTPSVRRHWRRPGRGPPPQLGLHAASVALRSRSFTSCCGIGPVASPPDRPRQRRSWYRKFSHASPRRRSSGCGTTSCSLDRSSVHTAAGCQAPRRSARIPSANRNCNP